MQYNKVEIFQCADLLSKVMDMNSFGNMLRNFFQKASGWMRRFMTGRYGTDRLNMVILCAGLAASLISAFVGGTVVGVVCWFLSYGLMFWAIFRCLSRNTYRRYEENRRFLMIFDRLKDRKNRYFSCPKCRQTVRVPRGKGKIAITCPKCKERFIRKT